MIRSKNNLLSICFCFLFSSLVFAQPSSVPVHVIAEDALAKGPVSLQGLWAFDWQELHLQARRTMQDGLLLPGLWHQQGPYDRSGYGTFRAVVAVPKFQPYFLYIPDAPSALAVWVNGQQVYRRGVVASEAAFERPEFGPDVVKLPAANEYELVLHVSNFHHKEGGMWHSLKLADEPHKHLLLERGRLIEAMIFTFLLSASFYLLATYWQRKRRTSVLLFVAFLWAIAARSVLVGERIAYDVVDASWLTLQRFEHGLLWLALPLFLFYLHRVFSLQRQRILQIWAYCVAVVSFAMMSVIALTPATVFAYTGQVFQVMAAAVSLYCLVVLIVLTTRGVAKSRWFLFSFVGFLVLFVHDIFYTNLWIQSRPLAQFGILFFVGLQSFLLWQTRFKEHRMVRYIRLAIEQRIDHIAQSIQAEHALRAGITAPINQPQTLAITELVAAVRPYFDVMQCGIQLKLRAHRVADNVSVVADANWLQQVLLCMGRLGDATDMRTRLVVSDSREHLLIRLVIQGAPQSVRFNRKLTDWLLLVVAHMGGQLCFQRGRHRTHVYFKLALADQAKTQPRQLVISGREGAPTVLVHARNPDVYEASLGEHYQLVFATANLDHLQRFRPSLVVIEETQQGSALEDVVQSLRTVHPQLPIVVALSSKQKLQLSELIRTGASDYMVMPLVQEEVLLRVQAHLMRGDAQVPAANRLNATEERVDLRELTVQLVRNCIQLWQSYTGGSKAELAERSKLWRVYLDGSTAKTRTLDKYLSLQSLPQKPRWDTVSRTALFVMEHCALNDGDRDQLQQQLQRLQQQLAL